MKRPPKRQPVDTALWNSLNPVGSPCELTLDDGTKLKTRTTSACWLLGHGDAVVCVEGKSGGWLLDRVRILETHTVPKPQPCTKCPWISREQRDIDALTPAMKAAASEGRHFECHVHMGPCRGAINFREKSTKS